MHRARSARGTRRQFLEGSVTPSVLHSAPLPVALAPRGYAPGASANVSRITCAVSATPKSLRTASTAHHSAPGYRCRCGSLTFVVRDRQMYPTGAGYQSENMVANQWRAAGDRGPEGDRRRLAVQAAGHDGDRGRQDLESGLRTPCRGRKARSIAVGSSNLGPLLRVFLGSNAAKILHTRRFPCLVLPGQGAAKAA